MQGQRHPTLARTRPRGDLRHLAGVQVAPPAQPPPGVSALRVSKAVRSNLQADAGGATEYKGATAGAGNGDVQLHTPDAEVDFDERGSDAGKCGDGCA